MTRPSFAADPAEAVVRVLQQAGSAQTAGQIKSALVAGGVAQAEADRAWPSVQKRLRGRADVIFADKRYRWSAPTPPEALERILKGNLSAATKAEFAAVVRGALAAELSREEAARRRQAAIDAVRALAELASEVEELTFNGASAEVLVFRVRARVKRAGLEPIGRAGEKAVFDRKRHKPVGGAVRDGAAVLVARPGYVWKAPSEAVLLEKALVEVEDEERG